MLNSALQRSNYPNLKEYSQFLLAHCLEEAAVEYLKLMQDLKLPLLKTFDHLQQEQISKLIKGVLMEFLTSLSKGKALEAGIEAIQKWQEGTHPLVTKESIKLTDISLLYHSRKLLLLNFIPRFTKDAGRVLSLAKELEKLFAQIEGYAFQAFTENRKKEHVVITKELQESNKNLTEQISIRKATEATLEKERNYLQAILENISDGIVACDEQGVLSFFNKATRNFHGLPEEALPAEEWAAHYQLYQPDGITPLRKEEVPLYRAYKGEYIRNVEIAVASTNGAKRYLLSTGQPIESSEGKYLGAVVVMHDITELKQLQQQQKEIILELNKKNKGLADALEKLKEKEEQLAKANNELEARIEIRNKELRDGELQMRIITDALPVLIYYIDTEERYRFINKAYEDWFKRSRKKVYGKKLEEILGETTYGLVKPYVQQALKGEKVYFELQLDINKNVKKHISAHYIPHFTADNQQTGYFALVTDISDYKNAQEKILRTKADLRKRNEELERINNDLDNFIYTASHDLKSPIVNLQGLTSIIKKKLSVDSSFAHMDLLEMVDKSVLKLKNTISDLTEIAKVQKDLEQDAREISFLEIAQDVKEDMAGMLAESGAEVREDYQVKEIKYPKHNIRSIFYNLLSNAVKYRSPARPAEISIKTFKEDGFVVLQVEDNGLGLNQQQQSKLFSMFKRFHSHVEGTGVGLYIIKRIVENRGGKITVESQQDKGSIFKVFLCSDTEL